MGWVVPGIIQRDLCNQEYRADEWEAFCQEHNVDVRLVETPVAFGWQSAIFLPQDHPPVLQALEAWHEIGHWVCHVGHREFWRRTIYGEYTLTKFERQAWEFAILFPDWRCYLDEGVGV